MNFRSSSMSYAVKCPLLGGEMSIVGAGPGSRLTVRQHINDAWFTSTPSRTASSAEGAEQR